MNLIELVKRYEKEISDNSILVQYDLYFREVAMNHSKFVIDEYEDLQILRDIISKLMDKDKNAEIYVNTYGMEFTEENIHIYADTLWLDTILEIEEIYSLFRDCRRIEPTDVVSLVDDETVDGTMALTILSDGTVVDYSRFIKQKQLCRIKSLCWD